MSVAHAVSHDTVPFTGAGSGPEDVGKLILRLALGLLILLHGVAKLRTGIDPIAGMLAQHGLPGALAYAVYIGEVVAPILLILGLWTQPAALVVAINMLVAITLAHGEQLLSLNRQGGWALELQAMYLVTAAAILFLGAGRLSLGGSTGRWN